MKEFIAPTYTFSPGPSGVGSVDLTGISGFNIKFLIAIINQTRGSLVYTTAAAAYRYTSVSGTLVTLFADTSAMSASDTLQVIYEVQTPIPVNTGLSQPLTNAELRANPVPVSGTVSISDDRETLSVVYTAIVPFTGASIGDVISATHIYDVSGASPTLISSIWRNETLNTTLVSAPSLSNLNISLSLTNAELRSAALSVIPNITRGSGVVDSNTQRVVVATDDVVSTSLSSINTKTPSLDNTKQPVIPSMTTGGHLSATTDVIGTNWVAFTSQALKQLTVSNQSGTNLEFRQGGAGVGFIVPNASIFTFFGITNSNQIQVRRVDTSNTQVSVTARWES